MQCWSFLIMPWGTRHLSKKTLSPAWIFCCVNAWWLLWLEIGTCNEDLGLFDFRQRLVYFDIQRSTILKLSLEAFCFDYFRTLTPSHSTPLLFILLTSITSSFSAPTLVLECPSSSIFGNNFEVDELSSHLCVLWERWSATWLNGRMSFWKSILLRNSYQFRNSLI